MLGSRASVAMHAGRGLRHPQPGSPISITADQPPIARASAPLHLFHLGLVPAPCQPRRRGFCRSTGSHVVPLMNSLAHFPLSQQLLLVISILYVDKIFLLQFQSSWEKDTNK